MEATDLVMYIIMLTFLGTIASVIISFYVLNKLNLHRVSVEQLRVSQDNSDAQTEKLLTSLTPMGQRIVALEAQVQKLAEQFQKLQEFTPTQNSQGHYHQARRIADLGGDEDSLMQDCGLTKIEAQMIKAMQTKTN